jgi:hypothetical protein
MGYLDVHAICCKDDWTQSISNDCPSEFAYFPFLFDAHVGDCPCINQIFIEEGCFCLWYVAAIKMC